MRSPATRGDGASSDSGLLLDVSDGAFDTPQACLPTHQCQGQVEELGIERDTFIFFCSDNGANRNGSNGPLRGFKGSLWEGGHRVSAVMTWPTSGR